MRGWGLVLLGGVLACACGGDDDGGTEPAAFRVVEVTPADGATDVELDAPVSILFSTEVDAGSLDGAMLISDTPADVVTDGATVTLVPREPYGFLQEVMVVVGPGVRNLQGESLGAEHRSTFTARFRRWQPRASIGDGIVGQVGGAYPYPGPQLAGIPDGRAVAVWQHGAADDLRVSWSIYQGDDDAWSEAAMLGQSGMPMNPQLASAPEGWMLAAWVEEATVRSARLDPTLDSFEAVETVHTDEALVSEPTAAVSSNGNAAVAFTSSANVSVFQRPLTGTWSGEVMGVGTAPVVAVGDSGTVWALWTNLDGTEVTARVFDGEAWGDAEPLWTAAGDRRTDRVRLVAGPSGAVAVWGVIRPAPDGAEVHVRIHQSGAWGDDEIIATPGSALDGNPELATNSRGDLLVAWDNGSSNGLYARWRRNGSWEPVATLTDALAPYHPIALDGDGNAVITYATDRALYYLAAQDRWIESELPLDTNLLRAAFAGADPVAIGQQEGDATPHVHATLYR